MSWPGAAAKQWNRAESRQTSTGDTHPVRRAVTIGALALAGCAMTLGVNGRIPPLDSATRGFDHGDTATGRVSGRFSTEGEHRDRRGLRTARPARPSPGYHDGCLPERPESDGIAQLLHLPMNLHAGGVNGQVKVPGGGHQKSPPLVRFSRLMCGGRHLLP